LALASAAAVRRPGRRFLVVRAPLAHTLLILSAGGAVERASGCAGHLNYFAALGGGFSGLGWPVDSSRLRDFDVSAAATCPPSTQDLRSCGSRSGRRA